MYLPSELSSEFDVRSNLVVKGSSEVAGVDDERVESILRGGMSESQRGGRQLVRRGVESCGSSDKPSVTRENSSSVDHGSSSDSEISGDLKSN